MGMTNVFHASRSPCRPAPPTRLMKSPVYTSSYFPDYCNHGSREHHGRRELLAGYTIARRAGMRLGRSSRCWSTSPTTGPPGHGVLRLGSDRGDVVVPCSTAPASEPIDRGGDGASSLPPIAATEGGPPGAGTDWAGHPQKIRRARPPQATTLAFPLHPDQLIIPGRQACPPGADPASQQRARRHRARSRSPPRGHRFLVRQRAAHGRYRPHE